MTQRQRIISLATEVLAQARRSNATLATAESCTGGLISGALTEIAGSSDVFDRGFVTYSNEAKNEMLGVPMDLIQAKGAVSAEVATVMAKGALEKSRATHAVSVTGIAGPGGGSIAKPVGLVWFGFASPHHEGDAERRIFPKRSRAYIRQCTVETALTILLRELRGA